MKVFTPRINSYRRVKSAFSSFFSFLLAPKKNKKRRPKTITPRFRYGSLIKAFVLLWFLQQDVIAGLNSDNLIKLQP
jgi:hypothetical protein